MQQDLDPDQIFSFVRESAELLSDNEIASSFETLLDEDALADLLVLARNYRAFLRASQVARAQFVPDAVGGFAVEMAPGQVVLAFEFKRREALAVARTGEAPQWLPMNPEVSHRWDTAASVPTLSQLFLDTAADHIVGDIEAFLAELPSACNTVDGYYIPLVLAEDGFDEQRLAFTSLPFADVFDRDFIVYGPRGQA